MIVYQLHFCPLGWKWLTEIEERGTTVDPETCFLAVRDTVFVLADRSETEPAQFLYMIMRGDLAIVGTSESAPCVDLRTCMSQSVLPVDVSTLLCLAQGEQQSHFKQSRVRASVSQLVAHAWALKRHSNCLPQNKMLEGLRRLTRTRV